MGPRSSRVTLRLSRKRSLFPTHFPAETDMVWSLEVHRGVLKKVNSTVKVYRIKHCMNALYTQSVSVPLPDVLAIFTFFKI